MIDTSEGDDAHRRRLAAHLDAMLALCETVECRRAQLLAYFGEESAPPAATATPAWRRRRSGTARSPRRSCCPRCSGWPAERDQKFGAGQIIDILLGKKTPKVTQYGHDQLTVFGIGAELREAEWRGVVRQLLAQGLLAVEGDYGTLELTEASAAVLRGTRGHAAARARAGRPSRSQARPRGAGQARAARRAAGGADLTPEAAKVFERLRAWRAATAKEQGVPAYVIFHDATLRQIAAEPPHAGRAVGINGVGENKLAKYGQQILDVLGA